MLGFEALLSLIAFVLLMTREDLLQDFTEMVKSVLQHH